MRYLIVHGFSLLSIRGKVIYIIINVIIYIKSTINYRETVEKNTVLYYFTFKLRASIICSKCFFVNDAKVTTCLTTETTIVTVYTNGVPELLDLLFLETV